MSILDKPVPAAIAPSQKGTTGNRVYIFPGRSILPAKPKIRSHHGPIQFTHPRPVPAERRS